MRALVLASLIAISGGARAEQPRTEIVVVVGQDPQFDDALEDALAPASITAVSSGEVGTPTLAELPARSRDIADRATASATIWLVPAGAGSTLVAYDRGADRVLVRELPYASPFSGTQAAEAARIVRTMLRALRDAPEVERTPPPPPPPSPLPPAAPREPQLAASAGAGVWFAAPAADGTFTGLLTLAWRPHGLGLAASAALAPRADIRTATFTGHVRDLAFSAEVRNAISIAPHWRMSPAFGLSLHAIQVEGSSFAAELASRRYDPGLRVGLTLGYELPRVEVGLAVSADCLLRRQKYVVGNEEILVVPRVQGMTGLVVGIRL